MSEVEREFHPNLYSNNPKHYDLFFCGDSWTYGGELDQLNPELYEYRRENRFSNIVSKKLNKTHYTIARGGVGNDWIVQHTVDWIEKGNSCDIAVIQFTANSRISFFYKKEYYSTQLIEIEKEIPEILTDDYNAYQNYKKNLFFIDLYLKSKNIKPIYLTIQERQKFNRSKHKFWESYCKDIRVQNLCHIMDFDKKNNYIKPQLSINKTLNGGHPSVKGHIEIADYLINTIKSLGYL